MILFDHFIVMLIVQPALAMWDMRRFERRMEAGDPGARVRVYREGMASQWTTTAALLIHWAWQSRDFADLGLVWPSGPWFWISLVISVGAVAIYTQQTLAVAKSPASQAKVRDQLTREPAVALLLPRTPGEARAFTAVGVTAGICEEILCRGFLLWYFLHFLGPAVAATVACVIFGVGHAYQGLRGIILTGLAGGVEMVIYLVTGSLFAPIVLHAAIDIGNGRMGRHALAGQPA